MPLRSPFPSLAIAVVLAACNYPAEPRDPSEPPEPPALVSSARAAITLHLEIGSALDARLRAACADEVYRALQRHGFTIGTEGANVQAELVLAEDVAADLPDYASTSQMSLLRASPTPRPSQDAVYSAEISAKVAIDGATSKTLRVAATQGASVCGVVGDRFAAALIGALERP